MPKKLYPTEPPVIFNALLEETRVAQPEGEEPFTVKTTDWIPPKYASELIDQHFPPQSQLPLD